VRFIERAKDRPFFLYLAHFAVHTPIQGRPDLVAKYKAKVRAGRTHTNAGTRRWSRASTPAWAASGTRSTG